jgi:hypothetical protein
MLITKYLHHQQLGQFQQELQSARFMQWAAAAVAAQVELEFRHFIQAADSVDMVEQFHQILFTQ